MCAELSVLWYLCMSASDLLSFFAGVPSFYNAPFTEVLRWHMLPTSLAKLCQIMRLQGDIMRLQGDFSQVFPEAFAFVPQREMLGTSRAHLNGQVVGCHVERVQIYR